MIQSLQRVNFLKRPRRLLPGMLALSLLLCGCAGSPPDHLGLHDGSLYPCPKNKRNCVSSDEVADTRYYIDSLAFGTTPDAAWHAVSEAVAGLPRVKVVTRTTDYMHVECTSAWFGFVDDLELHLRADRNEIAVRSGARIGYSDNSVNRWRIDHLRSLLAEVLAR